MWSLFRQPKQSLRHFLRLKQSFRHFLRLKQSFRHFLRLKRLFRNFPSLKQFRLAFWCQKTTKTSTKRKNPKRRAATRH
jgi:hypothetical protein